MKTMNDAMHTTRNYTARLAALFLALSLLIGTAVILAVTSPPSNAAELDSADLTVAETVETEPDGEILPNQLADVPAVSETVQSEDDVGNAEEEEVWFKTEVSTTEDASTSRTATRAAHTASTPEPAETTAAPDPEKIEKTVSEPEPENVQPEPAAQSLKTLRIFGEDIPYIYSYNVVSAPNKGCGIWKGVDDVNDGEYTYFVGHNPGDFYNVMNLTVGDMVTLMDGNGNSREYTVHDVFTIAQRTTFQQIQERVEGHGESIIMQTCCGDNVNVRVVVAW